MSVLCCLIVLAQSDPLLLPIGAKGEVTVEPGKLWNLRTGKPAELKDVVAQARRKSFVFIGEQHATAAHQQFEADVVEALVGARRPVAVGLEMITRPKQSILDKWTAGELAEEQFLTDVDWKKQWGYDYKFYKPLLEAVRTNKLPVIGLNVPREWVRAVGKSGFAGLSAEAKAELPAEMSLTNEQHRQIFGAMMGGHPMTGTAGENIYSAQVLWDEGMADTALKYIEKAKPARDAVFVVIAGSGHVMYGQGINFRIQKRTRKTGVNIVMIESDEPVKVARGLADFVFVSPKKQILGHL